MSTEAPKKDVVVPTVKPTKPEKPDDAQFKKDKEQAQKELNETQESLNEVRKQLDQIAPRRDGPPSEIQKKQQALRKELSEIRAQQANSKGSSNKIRDEKTALEADLKSRIAEQKKRKDALPYKTLNELNNAIERMEKDVESGTMRLVDERRALDSISRLKKQRRNFDDLEAAEKKIAEIKAAIDEKKQALDDPEVKKLGARYAEIIQELDAAKAKQDEAFKQLNTLRDEKTALQKTQNEKYQALRKLNDDFSKARKAYKEWEDEYYKAKKERQRAEREAEERERRKKLAEQKLEEASAPAFEEEISRCETLIGYFDPSAPEALSNQTKAPLLSRKAELQPEAAKIRTVSDSGLEGKKLSKKEDREEEYFMGGGGGKKKGKKGGNKAVAAAPADAPAATSSKFNVPYAVIEQCVAAKVDPPTSQAQVAATVEKLRGLLVGYKRDQKAKTEANIAAAKKEIAKLEAEAEAIDAKATPAPATTTETSTPVEAASPAPVDA